MCEEHKIHHLNLHIGCCSIIINVEERTKDEVSVGAVDNG